MNNGDDDDDDDDDDDEKKTWLAQFIGLIHSVHCQLPLGKKPYIPYNFPYSSKLFQRVLYLECQFKSSIICYVFV